MAGSEKSDSEILKGCLRGESESWNIFVERYAKLIYWSIHRTLKSQPIDNKSDHHEDIFQNIFKKLLEKEELERLRDISGLKKYLIVLSCRATLDHIKTTLRFQKRMGEPLLGLDESLEPRVDAQEVVLDREKKTRLNQFYEALSEKEKACLELACVENRTHKEIADLLNLPQDTVSTIIRRAKEKLRKKLDEKNK